MRREEIIIPDQGHTLACILRRGLFENEAESASCVVVHPQDTTLKVEIKHEDPKKCLLMALRDARDEIEEYMKSVNNHVIQQEMLKTSPMEEE